jgi:hypothetical protein
MILYTDGYHPSTNASMRTLCHLSGRYEPDGKGRVFTNLG